MLHGFIFGAKITKNTQCRRMMFVVARKVAFSGLLLLLLLANSSILRLMAKTGESLKKGCGYRRLMQIRNLFFSCLITIQLSN